jgi:flagellar assembly protein FliH
MSSRILLPGEQYEITLPAWRQSVPAAGNATGTHPMQPDAAGEIARMQQQCDQRVAEARATGLRDGEVTGRSLGAALVQPVIERFARSMEEIAGLRPRLRREAEADMLRLSLAIARRIMRREISIDPEAMHGLVLGALDKLQSQEISRVRVHPAQVEAVASALRQATVGNAIEVVGDPSREPGAAFFETTHGNLDASVDSQLQEIERGLVDRLDRPA